MRLIGEGFSLDVFAAELFFRLRGPEQISCQLRAAHVVEDLLTLLQLLPPMNVLRVEATVEPHVAMILENSIIHWLDHPCDLGGTGQFDVVEFHFISQQKAAVLFGGLIGQLLSACLDGKVGLPQGNDFF